MTKAVLYLTQASLLIQTEKKVLEKLDLADFVEGKDIKDEAAFTLFLKDHLEPLAKKIDQGIIVLGLGLLFQKAIEKDENSQDVKKELLATAGISEKNVQEKTIDTPAKSYLLLTDKSYYETVLKVCQDVGIEVLAVLPLSLFSDGEEMELQKEEVKTILKKEQLYEAGNFLQEVAAEEQEEDKVEEEKTSLDEPVISEKDDLRSLHPYETLSVWNKARLLLILGFLVVLTLFLGGLIFMQQTHQSLIPFSTPTPTPTEAPTPTPTPQSVSKVELSVEVQNGTGTPGQAAKAKGLMEGIEYTKVTTGNAENTDHETTEVVFSKRVSDSQQKEVKDLLLKSFKVVTTKVDQTAATDILIITGSEK